MRAGMLSRRRVLGASALGAASLLGTRRAWSEAGPIRIGALYTTSGPVAQIGISNALGARIAAKMINDAGGVDGRMIELVFRDSRMNPNEVIAGLHEMASNNINLILSDVISGSAIAAWPVVPALDMVAIAPATFAMELTHQLYNRNCFRAGLNARMQLFGEAKLLAEKYPGLKKWGCIEVDTVAYRTTREYLYAGLKKYYAAKGNQLELAEPALAKIGATDYRDQIAHMATQNLQGIVTAIAGNDLINFLKQSTAVDLFHPVQAVADITYVANLGPTMRKRLPKGWWVNYNWSYDLYKSVPLAKTFNELMVAETKQTLTDQFAVQANVALFALVAGVRAAGTTNTDAVIKAIETTAFDTIYGPLSFRTEDHQLKMNAGYLRLEPQESEEGWTVAEFQTVPWQDMIEPARPGMADVLTE